MCFYSLYFPFMAMGSNGNFLSRLEGRYDVSGGSLIRKMSRGQLAGLFATIHINGDLRTNPTNFMKLSSQKYKEYIFIFGIKTPTFKRSLVEINSVRFAFCTKTSERI